MLKARASRVATLGLSALVAILLGTMAVLAIASLGVNAERALSREARLRVQDKLGELAYQMSYRLDRSMFERYRDIQVASSLDTLRAGSDQSRRQVLERLKETYPDYAWIGITDMHGKVIVSTDRLLEGESVAERPWFAPSLSGPYVGDVHEAKLLARLLPRNGNEVMRFVDVAAPVHGPDGSVIGVLGAHLSWTWAGEVLNSILRQGSAGNRIEIFLLGSDGTVLLGPEASFGKDAPCPLGLPTSSPEGGALLISCADGGQYAVALAKSAGYRFYPGLGWQVLVRQPVDAALAPIAMLRQELLMAGLVLAGLFMMVGWFLAGWIAKPLRQIARAAERIRSGERDAAVPPSNRYAEVASLTGSLTELIDALKSTETDLRKSAAEIEQRERFQSAIMENMQDALFVNKGGRIVFANKAFVQLVRAPSAEGVIGLSPLDLFAPDYHPIIKQRIQAMSERVVQVPMIEEKINCLDGTSLDVEVSAASFEEHGNHTIIVILRDISARRLTERQLLHAQRLEAVGHLTGGMAHDFNNLLTVIIGNLDLLSSRLKEDRQARDLAEMALTAGLRGAELTRQLLAFSRRQSLDPKVFRLRELVSGTTDLLRRTLGERIEVRIAIPDDLWPALADPAQTESAIANLAINARDAMPNGGVLTIEAANKHLDDAYAAENPEVAAGDYVMLAVSDTGTGIAPEVLARVFEPFFTTKQDGKGSGLGLSMIYGFAKQSRGHVKIYSELGHGTTVRVYLPRAAVGERREAAANQQEAAQPASHAVILVVEDKAEVRQVVAKQLAELGYQAVEAENAKVALDILRSGQRIDLLFTDVVMPGGKTGIVLAKEARKLRPDLKTVFTSGFAAVFDGQEQEARMLGPLLSKPYRQQELARQIREALRENAAQ